MQMLCKSFLILEESRGWHGQYILKKGFLHVNYVLKRFPVETIWRYTWKLRMGERLTYADIEDVVKSILSKPQPWRPKSFSTAERSTEGEKSPCVYMSAPKLALRLFGCVLEAIVPSSVLPYIGTLCDSPFKRYKRLTKTIFYVKYVGRFSLQLQTCASIWSSTKGKTLNWT